MLGHLLLHLLDVIRVVGLCGPIPELDVACFAATRPGVGKAAVNICRDFCVAALGQYLQDGVYAQCALLGKVEYQALRRLDCRDFSVPPADYWSHFLFENTLVETLTTFMFFGILTGEVPAFMKVNEFGERYVS